ncbi:hypothetical protein FHS56_001004 [Thermonema lapsum]|uniref:Uncharacterized protein n=1 Tax=Thermonema lapsum TaxID=28195 RepID=A0A846MPJ7_9BACT|nr:hypothetical protein [Thermonema lapsum]
MPLLPLSFCNLIPPRFKVVSGALCCYFERKREIYLLFMAWDNEIAHYACTSFEIARDDNLKHVLSSKKTSVFLPRQQVVKTKKRPSVRQHF